MRITHTCDGCNTILPESKAFRTNGLSLDFERLCEPCFYLWLDVNLVKLPRTLSKPQNRPYNSQQMKGGDNMATLAEFAKSYEPKKTKNISELSVVPTDLQLEDDEFMGKDFETGESKVVKQKIVVLNGESYRVPFTVITDLQAILKQNPNLKSFQVSKKGSGKGTKYTVIPLG